VLAENTSVVTKVSSSNAVVAAGQSVTLTATVTPGDATGTVQFFDGSNSVGTVAVNGGAASLGITTLSAGNHAITAVYSGDSYYLTSTSAVFT
jgi:hypothetical protein